MDATGETGSKALREAVAKKASTIVKILLDHGARDSPLPPGSIFRGEQPAMLTAVNLGALDCVALLLPHADLGWLNVDGRTALQEAEQFAGDPRSDAIAQMIRDESRSRLVQAEVQALSDHAGPPNASSAAPRRI